MLRKWLMPLVCLPLAAAACKTASTAGVKDAAGSGLYCKFAAAYGEHETFQLWASSAVNQLNDVGYDHALVGAAAATAPTTTLGNLQPVSGSVITANGQRGLRSMYKSLLKVDFNQYTCYQLAGQNTAAVTFFCLSNAVAGSNGQKLAMLATNQNAMPFVGELTAFGTTCTGAN